jgi:hypothetical protein
MASFPTTEEIRMTTTTDASVTVDHYFEAWNDTDPRSRLQAVARVWSPEGRYVDPVADVTGHEAISNMIGGVHEQYPGVTFRCSSEIDSHHDVIRFNWEILDANGGLALSGVDVARLDDEGRLLDVRGFFESSRA